VPYSYLTSKPFGDRKPKRETRKQRRNREERERNQAANESRVPIGAKLDPGTSGGRVDFKSLPGGAPVVKKDRPPTKPMTEEEFGRTATAASMKGGL
jgi:hypothetical protein